jgi:hypothetical protein
MNQSEGSPPRHEDTKLFGCRLLPFFVSLCLGGSIFQFNRDGEEPLFVQEREEQKVNSTINQIMRRHAEGVFIFSSTE